MNIDDMNRIKNEIEIEISSAQSSLHAIEDIIQDLNESFIDIGNGKEGILLEIERIRLDCACVLNLTPVQAYELASEKIKQLIEKY